MFQIYFAFNSSYNILSIELEVLEIILVFQSWVCEIDFSLKSLCTI